MNNSNYISAIAIKGVVAKHSIEELKRNANTVIDIVNLSVSNLSSTFYISKSARKIAATLYIVNKML